MRQRDLSKYCKTDINVTSQALRKLELKGMIERTYRKGNNKARYPVLTDLGRETLAKAYDISNKNHTEFFNPSSDSHTLEKTLLGLIKQ